MQAHQCSVRAGLTAWPWLKSSSTSARCGAAKAPPKRVHFRAAAAEANRSALAQILIFGDRQRKRAMEHVAGAQRIHGVHREGRRLLQALLLVEPDRALRRRACPPGTTGSVWRSSSAPRRRRRCRRWPAAASLENTRCEEAVSSPSRSDIGRSTSTITGMPRRRASTQRSVQNSAQRFSVRMAAQSSSSLSASGRRTFHNSGSRKVTMVRSPLGSIMMLEIGVTRPGMWTMCLVSMPSCASLSKIYLAEVSRASPIGPQIEARPPSRTIPIAALSALPPQISSKWLALTLEPRAGSSCDAKRQVAHRHADAQNARRDFRRGGVKVHAGIRHAGSAFDRNQRPGLIDRDHERVPAMHARPGHHAASARANDGQWRTDAARQGRPDVAA